MKMESVKIDSLLIVTDALVGASGKEMFGGATDGAPAPQMVIAQIEITSLAPDRRGQTRITHLGMTREGALDLARQLRNAAEMLDPDPTVGSV